MTVYLLAWYHLNLVRPKNFRNAIISAILLDNQHKLTTDIDKNYVSFKKIDISSCEEPSMTIKMNIDMAK